MIRLTHTIDTSAHAAFDDPKFKILLEQHMEILTNPKRANYLTISNMDMEMWQGNLLGYLQSQNVPAYQHWLIMRMNNMDSPHDFYDRQGKLFIPDVELLTRLKELYTTVHKI